MKGRIQTLLSTILIVTLCALRSGLAEVNVTPQFLSIPGFSIDLTKCWSSLFNVQGCVIEIYKTAITGKFGNVEPTCCKTFMDVDAKCWPKMFPLNPFFPPLLKNACSRINAAAPTHTTPELPTIPRFSFPGTPINLEKCWSSLMSVRGCVTEIHKSVFTGKFENVRPMCCKASSAMDAKCWSHMFPLNPFFPPLFKDACSRINAAAPTHK